MRLTAIIGATIRNIRLASPLGVGAMGEVYEGFDEALKRRVAVKVMRAERRMDTRSKAR